MLPRYLGVERQEELIWERLWVYGGNQELDGGIVSHVPEQMNSPTSAGKQFQWQQSSPRKLSLYFTSESQLYKSARESQCQTASILSAKAFLSVYLLLLPSLFYPSPTFSLSRRRASWQSGVEEGEKKRGNWEKVECVGPTWEARLKWGRREILTLNPVVLTWFLSIKWDFFR